MEYAIYINGSRSSKFYATMGEAVQELLHRRDNIITKGDVNLVVSELSENAFAVYDKVSQIIYCYAIGGR